MRVLNREGGRERERERERERGIIERESKCAKAMLHSGFTLIQWLCEREKIRERLKEREEI